MNLDFSRRVSGFAAVSVIGGAACAAECANTSVGLTPISQLGPGLYLGGFQGGLYPGGANQPPQPHHMRGVLRAGAVIPRNTMGQPDAGGRYVLLSIGMSNTTQEYNAFIQAAAASPLVNHTTLAIVDGAAGGQTASTWDSPTDANYDRVRDERLAPLGLTEAQVQAAWVKVANAGPMASLPAPNADARALEAQMGDIARAMRVRYPNLQLIFFSSRIYAGYASTQLNPEPYAYESAFGVKWVVAAQIEQMASGTVDPESGDLQLGPVAPWLGWGPYLWADGLTPRPPDGLVWACADFANDGTHPSPMGREKVADMLMGFFLNSPYTRTWFRAESVCETADLDGDGVVGGPDLAILLGLWGSMGPEGDINGDGFVGGADLAALLGRWGACE